MSKSLVIVESPAKAKTINKYLGPGYVVKSSVGHIRDLPTGSKSGASPKERAAEAAKTRQMSPAQKARHKAAREKRRRVARMGVDPEKGWAAKYETIPGKTKVVKELQGLARNADAIYLATDLDREGEAIAWHLREVIGGDPDRYRRVVFNEITQRAIDESFASPGKLDMRYVEAQQARRFLDRVVGFMLSPLLWENVARNLSAGRVQSVAVRLVVEREREIGSFLPEEYWEVFADLETGGGETLRCQVAREKGKAFRPGGREQAERAVAALGEAKYRVSDRQDRQTRSNPPPPLITSTLQQAASNRLGFGVKKTMQMAQRLYEAGHITYMRTDSTQLSEDSVAACRKFIRRSFGEDYLPEKAPKYAAKKGAQEAHEAVRPTDVTVRAGDLKDAEADAARLYDLIRRYFVACQMPPARYLSSRISVAAGDFELRATGRIMQFDGYLKVLPSAGEDVVLPAVKENEPLKLLALDPAQHFTRPPPRFTEASLVKELEKRAIGRPSTYASIISTIQERGYVKAEGRRFRALKIGDVVSRLLIESFGNLMDYEFTARMEKELDEVADGNIGWKELLDGFYRKFSKQLVQAEEDWEGKRANPPTDTDIECPDCGRTMQVRIAATGVFLGCSGYSLPKAERCGRTINLAPGDEAVRADSVEEAEAAESALLRAKRRCPHCNTAMDGYLVDETRKLHICGDNPACPGFEVEQGKFKIRGYEGPTLDCDKCGAEMRLKVGPYGKYFGCTGDGCRNARKLLRDGRPAPPKMDPIPMPELACENFDDHFVLRDGATGLFLGASKYPRHREARGVLVEELRSVRDRLPDKYAHLPDAPAEDDQGHKTVVRMDRKAGEQYVRGERDGKPTGWRAHYRDGSWVAAKAEPKTVRRRKAPKKRVWK